MPFAEASSAGMPLRGARTATVRLLSGFADLRASLVRRAGSVPAIQAVFQRKPESSLREWILPVIRDLELLNHGTEEDFLRIGGELAALIGSIQGIRSSLERLTGGMAGESIARTAAALSRAHAHSVAITASSSEDSGRVNAMRKTLAPLKQELAGFDTTIITFRTVAVLTRIETSRLSQSGSGFDTLASDMTQLAESLETRVKRSIVIADSLIAPIEQALADLASVELDQAANLPSLIEKISAQLSSFQERLQHAGDLSATLGVRYDAIAAGFRQVIVALQVHDITRQQVEHVAQTLRSLVEESTPYRAEDPAVSVPRVVSRSRRASASILALQSLQLEHAGNKFAVAVSAIMKSLDQIAIHICELSEESRRLLDLSESEKQNLAGDVEEGYTAVLAGLQHCAKASSTSADARTLLQQAINSMRPPVSEIQMFELQILRLAMNASICAVRAGSAGDCLGVLALSVQKLALDSKERSDFILQSLSLASGTHPEESSSISASTDPSIFSASPDEWMEQLRLGVADLQSSTTKSCGAVAAIVASGSHIREELEATCRSFRVGSLFSESMSRAHTSLQQISDRILAEENFSGPADLADDLAGLQTLYTMQSEREVHEAFLHGDTSLLTIAPADRAEEVDRNADDGVEFF